MVKVKNKLKYWRHQCQMNQNDFAEFLGINYSQYNRMEKHPERFNPNKDTTWAIWLRLKERFPDIHIENLWEEYGD